MLISSSSSIHRRLDFLFFYTLIVATLLFQYFTRIEPVHSFSYLGFISADDIYLTERFMYSHGNKNIPLLNSLINIDYGSEFWILSPFFSLYEKIFSISNPIHYYYFCTFVHAFSAILALVLIRNIFIKEISFIYTSSLFALLTLSSPFYQYNLSYLKPDPNIIVLLMISSFYFFHKYKVSQRPLFLYFCIFSSALATSIKWWGVLFLIPLACFNLERQGKPVFSKRSQLVHLSILVLIGIPLYMTVIDNIFVVLEEWGNDLGNPQWVSAQPQGRRLTFQALLFLQSSMGKLVFCVLIASFSLAYIKTTNLFSYFEKKDTAWLRGGFFLNATSRFLKVFPLFCTFFLVTNYPLLQSSYGIPSYAFYSKSHTALRIKTSVLEGMSLWVDFFVSNRIVTLAYSIILPMIFLVVWKNYRKIKISDYTRISGFYVLSLIMFLLCFIKAPHAGVSSLAFVCFLFCLFFLIRDVYPKEKTLFRKFFTLAVGIFVISQVYFQNFDKNRFELLANLQDRQKIPMRVDSLKNELSEVVKKENPGENFRIFSCRRDFPIYNNFKYRLFSIFEVRDQADSLDEMMHENDFLIIQKSMIGEIRSQLRHLFLSNQLRFLKETSVPSSEKSKKSFVIFKKVSKTVFLKQPSGALESLLEMTRS